MSMEEIRTTVNFAQVSQLLKAMSVSEGDNDQTVMDEGGEGGDVDGFLASSETCSGNEHAGVLSGERTGSPKLACSVPEGL